ncbi:glycosyltransferase [Frigidibacter sp. MR17.14]|uniref:glycosyltransferase n=1 Tax=Frigidibacter sp. MR17.14 TaxID=3126509 RepID=UPI0030131386
MRLHAVVVTHDRCEQLHRTVTRLLREPLDAIHVVDNASSDGTPEMLSTFSDPRLHVLRQADNLGGAGGFAKGLAAALGEGADWVVVMDDDGRPEPGTLSRFRRQPPTEHEAVASAVLLPGGRICEMNRPGRNPFARPGLFLGMLFGGLGRFRLHDAAYRATAPIAIDAASFVGLFLSATCLHRGGLPDPRLFIYGDDVLYCLRLRAEGLRLAFDPRLRFEHDCRTLHGSRGIFRPLWKTYFHHRNLIFVLRAAAGARLLPLVVPFALAVWTARVRFYRREERGRYLSLLARAVRDGLNGCTDASLAEIRGLAGEVHVPPQAPPASVSDRRAA